MVRALLLHDLIAPTPKLRIEGAVVPIIVSSRHHENRQPPFRQGRPLII